MEDSTSLMSDHMADTVARATPEKRESRKCMSRRSGQSGHIEKSGNWYVVRFWMDVPGQEKRKHMCAKINPIKGPGSLTKPERERKAREIIAESGADTPECLAHAEGISSGITFRQQAAWWINHVQQRKRKPIAPATVESWQGCLDVWILPDLGEIPLFSVGNLALKGLVEKMVKAGLSPKTVNTYSQVVKAVVASAVNEEGEQLFPRKWNHEFIDMPVVEKSKQNTPHFTCEVIAGILASTKGYKQMFCALLAGTGLRAGEAIGLEIDKHISKDFRTLFIRQKVRSTKLELFLKTDAGRRDVDLCPKLAAMLKEYVGNRTSGLLFHNRKGNFLSQTNLLRRGLHQALEKLKQPKAGFHAFRRYRLTWLRKNRVHADLERFWMGHENETVGDGYSKMKDDVAFRLEEAEITGLGFAPPPETTDVVRIVRKNQATTKVENAA
ncbi:MAG TPA: tyrosine-type recombinase/integrase [Candidatus Acidoferrum sp.]|nr:tyrosine-type recombinase/integrase [Candidatus Acidoferrum sp.]